MWLSPAIETYNLLEGSNEKQDVEKLRNQRCLVAAQESDPREREAVEEGVHHLWKDLPRHQGFKASRQTSNSIISFLFI